MASAPDGMTVAKRTMGIGTREVGRKVVSLGDFLREGLREPEVLLGPWLKEGQAWMVYAPTGVGKTWFSLSVAYAVASGGSFLHWDAPEPRTVLVVDGEMAATELQWRLKSVIEACPRGDDVAAFGNLKVYASTNQEPGRMFPDLATEEGITVLLEEAKDADLVVLDNLTTLMVSGDENEASYWRNMQEAIVELKKLGKSVLIVHHANKSGTEQRGTSAKTVLLDGSMLLTQPPTMEPEDGAWFVVEFQKRRSLKASEAASVKAVLTEGPKGARWEYQVLDYTQERKLVALVRSCAYCNGTELGEAMGVSKTRISQLKKAAIAAGLITESEWRACLKEARDNELDDLPY